MLTESTLLPVL